MPTKIIVTHEGAMKKKYGANWNAISTAVKQSIAADAARGISTTYVALDTARPWPADAANAASFKQSIDHVFHLHEKPDYVAILGGPDIVPHQDLANPIGGDDAADDPVVPSDLPYACDAPASMKIETFVGPSRVIGRIPDLPGDADSSRLVRVLEQAATWTPNAKPSKSYFGLSAEVWKRSTAMSLKKIFSNGALHLSPLEGPKWESDHLQPLWHFINCHGAKLDPQFYGQREDSYPVSHASSVLSGKITPGTVVAAECCYGAELYDPNSAVAPGISMSYMLAGAIAFMGSTTIAYGPANSNGSADLICRFFLEAVRKGASLGRAFLEARLQFVKAATPLSPIDLKTLAQFLLLGDPSLRAIDPDARSNAKSNAKGRGKVDSKALRAHTLGRRKLESTATLLTRGADTANVESSQRSSDQVRRRLEAEATAAGWVPVGDPVSYGVREAGDRGARSVVMKSPRANTRFHVMAARPKNDSARPKGGRPDAAGSGQVVPKRMIVLGREVAGKLVKVEQLFAHDADTYPHG